MLESKIAARRTPILPRRRAGTAVESSRVEVRPSPPAARWSLRLRPADAEAAERAAGLPLDLPINRFAREGERSILRLGPDEWLVLGPEDDDEALGAALAASLEGRFHALVDIGHRNTAFTLSGPGAAEAISSGCALDLAAAAFPAGAGTRTLLGKSEVVLMRLDDAPTYRIEVWRSYARYLDSFLREAATDLGPARAAR